MGVCTFGSLVAAWLLFHTPLFSQTTGEGSPDSLDRNPFYSGGFSPPTDFILSPETISRQPIVDREGLLGAWGHGDGQSLKHLLGQEETAALARSDESHGNALLLQLEADGAYVLLLYYPMSDGGSPGSRIFIERGEFGWMGTVLALSPKSYREIVRIEGQTETAEVTRAQMPRAYALYTALFADPSADGADETPTNSGIILEGPVCPPFARVGDGYCSDLGDGRPQFRADLQGLTETRH